MGVSFTRQAAKIADWEVLGSKEAADLREGPPEVV